MLTNLTKKMAKSEEPPVQYAEISQACDRGFSSCCYNNYYWCCYGKAQFTWCG